MGILINHWLYYSRGKICRINCEFEKVVKGVYGV